MRYLFLTLAMACAACDSPSITMAGATKTVVQVEQSTFSVYQLGDRVEVIRTNIEYGRDAKGIMARAIAAIPLATGCEVVPGSLDGDPALLTAKVHCPT